ncbi:hypothetical protein TrST_g928 [Triparma strigata]|uniref:Uncharacterized protein n=1 Tax=Triparma strigata TaxID=1606541 RepID=A0A9W7EZB8_9STRA|nr:hypothetical protein TrST_g928 [Triparma strigata]
MPFSISELLLPGQTRSLHLYEARFLSLLEHAQTHSNNLVCVGLESNNGLLSLSVLASLSKVKRLEVGVSCDLKALQTLSLHNLLPYSEDYPFLLANCTAKPLKGDAQRCADLYEKLTTISSSITEMSNGQNVPISSNVELKIDPRAILGSIKPDDSKKAVSLKDRSEKANEDSSSGDGDDDNDSLLSLYSYSSYLAFEGFSLVDKIKVLSNESLEGRLMDGCRILGEKENEMRAKCMIKNLAEEWEEKN